jgi:hypothetical protein
MNRKNQKKNKYDIINCLGIFKYKISTNKDRRYCSSDFWVTMSNVVWFHDDTMEFIYEYMSHTIKIECHFCSQMKYENIYELSQKLYK